MSTTLNLPNRYILKYEQKLIQTQVYKQTGKAFLTPEIKNNNDQFRYLMDNALQAKEDLELSPGISLSKEQINSLTNDIVWLEERIVDNQTVLVPIVYIVNPNKVVK